MMLAQTSGQGTIITSIHYASMLDTIGLYHAFNFNLKQVNCECLLNLNIRPVNVQIKMLRCSIWSKAVTKLKPFINLSQTVNTHDGLSTWKRKRKVFIL